MKKARGDIRTSYILSLPLMLCFPACSGVPVKQVAEQVVVLGFDGVDPKLVSQWAEAGHLPNVKKLMRTGTVQPMGTTNPPESPVAWASFATGTNPGKHGIFDFLKVDRQNYVPDIGLVEISEGPDRLYCQEDISERDTAA